MGVTPLAPAAIAEEPGCDYCVWEIRGALAFASLALFGSMRWLLSGG